MDEVEVEEESMVELAMDDNGTVENARPGTSFKKPLFTGPSAGVRPVTNAGRPVTGFARPGTTGTMTSLPPLL